MYEYKCVELRSKMFGGALSGDKLERVLNEWAAKGWQLKSTAAVDVKGRIGPGGTDGLLITFERQKG
ncbi:DUF4177 domain-containing protein [Nocardioides zhouii]|uniref:DUF4177 domain-containing protein n=1 Tax=Nocardioides zhouii TaxID=1168729 RepID=A0A4Q2TBQ7_9ACTN|nr:DUF4177 domain-containing protein [Nocardioides zhouii]RYC14558.1 DUF4177 domain-containing protein [Nocardioides zhouii]